MGIKEERRILIETASPARHHSMNQRTLKQNLEWEREWRRGMEVPQEETIQEFSLDKDTLAQELPLGGEFIDATLDLMIEIAQRRTATEESGLTIPQRITNIATDVASIYNFAKKNGLNWALVAIDQTGENRRVAFRWRRETARYKGVFPRASLLPLLIRLPEFNILAPRTQAELVKYFLEAFEINLTSCDFTLAGEELVIERVKCYGYTLNSLGNLTYALFGNLGETRVSDLVLGQARKILNAKT